mmetsp:Transcript_896/g.2391  ORF Transcript_896/g.2391 Transcript_896/m.2391 type:complete len:80 (-) Transcript_896:348-587(-)
MPGAVAPGNRDLAWGSLGQHAVQQQQSAHACNLTTQHPADARSSARPTRPIHAHPTLCNPNLPVRVTTHHSHIQPNQFL